MLVNVEKINVYRPSDSNEITRDQEEQTLTLYGENEEQKQNGPIKSEKLFSELFTPPAARRRNYSKKDSSDSEDYSNQRPTAAPRLYQTDRPDITDKITVSLAYYHPNSENEKAKIYV